VVGVWGRRRKSLSSSSPTKKEPFKKAHGTPGTQTDTYIAGVREAPLAIVDLLDNDRLRAGPRSPAVIKHSQRYGVGARSGESVKAVCPK
jgi:hypothetical protein